MDSLRQQVRAHWQSVIDGHLSARDAAQWAERFLSDYYDEINFVGLMALVDLFRVEWEYAQGIEADRQFERYWGWMERAAQFDDDPAEWNRNWALNYLRRLAGHLSDERMSEIAEQFQLDGFLTADDVRGRFSS